jgi:heptose-I-phosphate ethanolaminephosphotransferase
MPRPATALRFASLLVLLGLPAILSKNDKFLLSNPFTFALHTGREVLSYRAELMFVTRDTPALLRAKVKAADRPAKHILIVGESLTPTHMATCGYTRNTTPEIDRKRAYERVVLCNACSTKSSTAPALMDVMTAQGRFASSPVLERPNLISTLQRNSYQVYWISNQTLRSGPDDSMVAVWSTFADQRWFTNLEGYQYDTSLLPRVESALRASGDRKVVLVHVEGAHPPYFLRYPPSFKRWPEQAEVPQSVPRRNDPSFERAPYNQYDNAVLHSDHLLGRLLELAEQYDVATVTYFSDHGQNLGETSPHLGHSLDEGPRQGFTVPVIFWISDGAAVGEEQRERLQEHARQPFQTDQLFASLLELYGIATEEPALANSLLSASYHPVERACDRMQ